MAEGVAKRTPPRNHPRAAWRSFVQEPDLPGGGVGGGGFGGPDLPFPVFEGESGSGTGAVSRPFTRLGAAGSPKITLAVAGRLRTAVAQSVGAACFPAGTFGSQIRHIPAGGL